MTNRQAKRVWTYLLKNLSQEALAALSLFDLSTNTGMDEEEWGDTADFLASVAAALRVEE